MHRRFYKTTGAHGRSLETTAWTRVIYPILQFLGRQPDFLSLRLVHGALGHLGVHVNGIHEGLLGELGAGGGGTRHGVTVLLEAKLEGAGNAAGGGGQTSGEAAVGARGLVDRQVGDLHLETGVLVRVHAGLGDGLVRGDLGVDLHGGLVIAHRSLGAGSASGHHVEVGLGLLAQSVLVTVGLDRTTGSGGHRGTLHETGGLLGGLAGGGRRSRSLGGGDASLLEGIVTVVTVTVVGILTLDDLSSAVLAGLPHVELGAGAGLAGGLLAGAGLGVEAMVVVAVGVAVHELLVEVSLGLGSLLAGLLVSGGLSLA